MAKQPPPGSPWDLPLREAPLAFVDVEMSGLDLERDRVLEIAITRQTGELQRDWVSLVRPEPFTYGAGHVHGIDEAELRRAPTFAELAPALRELLDGAVFIAHGARWDLGFLRKEAELAGLELPLGFYLDTLTLSRRAFFRASHTLAALAQDLELEHGRAHRADADVAVLREVFWRCATELGASSARELFQVRVAARTMREEVKQACQAAMAAERPLALTYRPSGRPAEELEFMILAFEEQPPKIIGYDLQSRARRELRGERIVAVRPS